MDAASINKGMHHFLTVPCHISGQMFQFRWSWPRYLSTDLM